MLCKKILALLKTHCPKNYHGKYLCFVYTVSIFCFLLFTHPICTQTSHTLNSLTKKPIPIDAKKLTITAPPSIKNLGNAFLSAPFFFMLDTWASDRFLLVGKGGKCCLHICSVLMDKKNITKKNRTHSKYRIMVKAKLLWQDFWKKLHSCTLYANATCASPAFTSQAKQKHIWILTAETALNAFEKKMCDKLLLWGALR